MGNSRTGKVRLFAALVAACPLFVAAFVLSQWAVGGAQGALLPVAGLIQLLAGGAVVALAAWAGRLSPAELGLSLRGWRGDAAIGASVALLFALIQFGLIIPMTGGAGRSDIATNLAQIGPGTANLVGMLVFQLLGPPVEELFFRGLLLGGVVILFRGGLAAKVAAVAGVTLLFALGHGYQGVAGMIDTGLYGGLGLSLLYLWRGTLVAPVAAHVGWNLLATVAMVAIYG